MVDFVNNPVLFDGTKAITLASLPKEAWTWMTGGETTNQLKDAFQSVAWLHRGVGLRARAVASMPFVIMRGETEVDASDDYQNTLGYLGDPVRLLGLIEEALTLLGYAYLFRERNRKRTLGLRYMLPTSVKPVIDKAQGLTGFKRSLGGQLLPFEVEDFCYFWQPDSYVEIGHPQTSPAQAALTAAGVILNVDEFAAQFFKRGAIKATILAAQGIPAPEREKLKAWWGKLLTGIKNAFATEIINAETVKPIAIGEGIQELANTQLTNEKREDISTAVGVPQSLLFSNAANFAVAQQDERHFYSKTIVPECMFIAQELNRQVLIPDGYRLRFQPETLPIFQEDEEQRSAAVLNYINAGFPMDLVAEMLGLDLPAGWEYGDLAKEEEPLPELAPAPEPPKQIAAEDESMRSHIAKWQRKALKRKPGTVVPFESSLIPEGLQGAIMGAMAAAQSKPDLRAVFDDALASSVWANYP